MHDRKDIPKACLISSWSLYKVLASETKIYIFFEEKIEYSLERPPTNRMDV